MTKSRCIVVALSVLIFGGFICGADSDESGANAPSDFYCGGRGVGSYDSGLAIVRLKCGYLRNPVIGGGHSLTDQAVNVLTVDQGEVVSVLGSTVAYSGANRELAAEINSVFFAGRVSQRISQHLFERVSITTPPSVLGTASSETLEIIPPEHSENQELLFLVKDIDFTSAASVPIPGSTVESDSYAVVSGEIGWTGESGEPCSLGCSAKWSATIARGTSTEVQVEADRFDDAPPDSPLAQERLNGIVRIRDENGGRVGVSTYVMTPLFRVGEAAEPLMVPIGDSFNVGFRYESNQADSYGVFLRMQRFFGGDNIREEMAFVEPRAWPGLSLEIPGATRLGEDLVVRGASEPVDTEIRIRNGIFLAGGSISLRILDPAGNDTSGSFTSNGISTAGALAFGRYSIEVRDDAGRTASARLQVSQSDAALVAIEVAPEGRIFEGLDVQLTAVPSAVGDYQFRWTGPNVAAPAAQSTVVTPMAPQSTYTVELLSADGLQAIAQAQVMIDVVGPVNIELGVSGVEGGAEVIIAGRTETCREESCVFPVEPDQELTLVADGTGESSPRPVFEYWEGDCSGSNSQTTVVSKAGLRCIAVFSAGIACEPIAQFDLVYLGTMNPAVLPADAFLTGDAFMDARGSAGSVERRFEWKLWQVVGSQRELVTRSLTDSLDVWRPVLALTPVSDYEIELDFRCGSPAQLDSAIRRFEALP